MVISVNNFPYEKFSEIPTQKRRRGNQGNHVRVRYKDIITAFDIETTKIPYSDTYQSFMYIWQWHFDGIGTVTGRTWEEFIDFKNRLEECLEPIQHLVVFVHNLSYEFQFLKGIWNFSNDEVFAVKSRKVLKCNLDKLEFRCSYLHSNMSLDEYTHKMGVEHAKKHNFDYDKVRYPWTELSEAEMEYCLSDVVGLVEAIKTEMQIDGDNLYTFPLTSTGYVRRDTKRAMRGIYHTLIPTIAPDLEQYQMLRDAFRGGDTHANRFFHWLYNTKRKIRRQVEFVSGRDM